MSDSTFFLVLGAALLSALVALLWVYRSSQREPGPPRADDEVILTETNNTGAEVMRAKLENAGIRSWLKNDHGHEPSLHRFPTWGWKVVIRYADREEARRILDLDKP